MTVELLPIAVGDGDASKECPIHSGDFMTFHISGTVTSGYIELQASWDIKNPAAWRPLLEDGVPKRCDVNNTAVRIRGPIIMRAVRKGTESIGCTASNLFGNRNL